MKCIAAVLVDLERSPLGTRCRLAEPLEGKPLLRRTVERLLQAERLDGVYLLTPPAQASAVRELVAGLADGVAGEGGRDARTPLERRGGDTGSGERSAASRSVGDAGSEVELRGPGGASTGVSTVVIETVRWPPAPYGELVRAGRWWGLDGWRGGLGGLCVFDEDMSAGAGPGVLAALAAKHDADAVAIVPAAAALIDPGLTDAMIGHFERVGRTFELTFAQTPPGLTPLIVSRRLLDELAPTAEPIGLILAYNPDRAAPDLTGKEASYRAAAEVVEASGRLICDTRRSFERVAAIIAAGGEAWDVGRGGDGERMERGEGAQRGAENWDARRLGSWLQGRAASHVEPVPCEIELELTTDGGAAPGDLLRPGGDEVPPRGPMSFDVVRAVVDAVRGWDDVRIVLGGFGDPCAHPAFDEVCRMLRPAAAALAVRTAGSTEDAMIDDALFETPVDVVEVMLDATTAETYQRLHGVDAFAEVTARIERWLERRVAAGRARPLIVPSFVKCNENLDEMEPFFETWQRRLGMVLVTGHSDFAGQRMRRAVTSMSPPRRTACRRLASRIVVLADGRVTTCDQDYRGVQALGRLPDATLMDLWHGRRLVQIRTNNLSDAPLCATCGEWGRP